MKKAITWLIIALIVISHVNGQEKEIERLEVNIERMESIINDNKVEIGELNGVIVDNQKKLDESKETIDQLNGKIENLESELSNQKNINNKQREEIKKLKPKQVSRGSVSRSTDPKGKLIGTFEATAYTDDVESQGQWVGKTASGMKPQVGVIAVDPKVIPLGTKLYVEGYGDCIAGDTGGAIKGKRLDLFYNTKTECRSFGRRNVKVYIRP